MQEKINGSCLCGKIRFTLTGPYDAFHLCHCSRCRKATGSAHAANIFTKPGYIQWLSGEDYMTRFELPTAERFVKSFCSICGSAVPCVSRDGNILLVPAGSLEGDPGIRPQDNIFWKDRGAWYDAALTAQRFDGYPE